MTTKKKLAYEIIRLLSAGPKPKDSKLDLRYVMTEVIQAVNASIKREHYQVMNDGQRQVTPLAIATYRDQPVLNDETFNRNYIDLPSFYIQLPGGVGLQSVRPQTGNASTDRPMIIVDAHEIDMVQGSLFSLEVLKDQWLVEPDRDKLWFSEMNDQTLLDAGIEEVEIKIVVVDPAEIGEDTNLPIDPATEFEVILQVLQLHGYSGKSATDLINNSNPNI